MKLAIRLSLVVVVLCLFFSFSLAMDNPGKKLSEDDLGDTAKAASKRDDIVTFLKMTNGRLPTQKDFDAAIAKEKKGANKFKIALLNELQKELNCDELMEKIIAIYDRQFTHEEIKELIEFYKTPFGKKVIDGMESVNSETIDIGIDIGTRLFSRMLVVIFEQGLSEWKTKMESEQSAP